METKKQSISSFLFLTMLLVFLKIPSIYEPFDNDSGAIAYHARLMVRGEPLYGQHHPGHHLPGVYFTYYLIFKLIGDSSISIKLILIPWTVFVMYLVFRMGFIYGGIVPALLSGLFFAIFTSDPWLLGNTGEIELFANLPRTLTIFLALLFLFRNEKAWHFVFVGIVGGISALYKAPYIASLGSVFLLFLFLSLNSGSKHEKHEIMKRTLWIFVGLLIPILLTASYFQALGLFDRFWIVFENGQGYLNQIKDYLPIYFIVIYPLYFLGSSNLPLAVFGITEWFAAFGRTLKIKGKLSLIHPAQSVGLSIVAWFPISIFEAGISRAPFLHYPLLVVPAMSLLAAMLISNINQANFRESTGRIGGKFLVLGMVFIGVVYPLRHTFSYYYSFMKYLTHTGSYESFLLSTAYPNKTQVCALKTAEFLKQNTQPEENVYVWSEDVQIYYLTDRKAPVDYIWPNQVGKARDPWKIFGPNTKYIVVGKPIFVSDFSDWFYENLNAMYEVVLPVDCETVIYRRR